jgi:hypothetical protein
MFALQDGWQELMASQFFGRKLYLAILAALEGIRTDKPNGQDSCYKAGGMIRWSERSGTFQKVKK